MSKLFRGDWVSRLIQIVTGASAAIGGVWVVIDQLGLLHGDILTWHPEYFEISDGPVSGEFQVSVAREKHRENPVCQAPRGGCPTFFSPRPDGS
jgi:hypothetical protein